MTVRVIDIETTGPDFAKDMIVEIASVDLTRDRTLTNDIELLVNPGRSIPPESSAVHHLIDEDVASAPPLRDVLEHFRGAHAYVAHNAKFEQSFLAEHLGEVKWICTYKCALRVWPDFPSHSNQALRYRLGLTRPFGMERDIIKPHRAMSDVIVTAAILVQIMNHASWSDIQRWSAMPALHTTFTFGKHKGQKFEAVPEDYLRWIIDKSDMDEDIKFSAQTALNARAKLL